MKRILQKCMAVVLCLCMLCGQAAAFSAAERFCRAADIINARGLIAEQSPIPEATIEEDAAYLEEHPEALSDILNDILSGMDSHSMYLTEEEYQSGFSVLSGYAGIGIAVGRTERGLTVQRVVRHSPAAAAGIQVGDRLMAIDGADVTGLGLDELAALLQGDVGSRIRVTVEREGETLDFSMSRETILEENVSARQAAPGVEYISISAFSSMNDAEDFEEIWQGLDEKETRAVILDLRDNGGGMIDAAFAMLDLMLEKKTLMATLHGRADQGGDEARYSSGGGLPLNKIVVLVNGNTASAAELMAGVLREAGGATLVGAQTYGKSQGQYHLNLDGDYLVLTCLEMQLPQSGSWEGKGLAPDVEAHPQLPQDGGRPGPGRAGLLRHAERAGPGGLPAAACLGLFGGAIRRAGHARAGRAAQVPAGRRAGDPHPGRYRYPARSGYRVYAGCVARAYDRRCVL